MDYYVGTLKKVLTDPEGFYSEMPKEGGYQKPLKFAAINFAIAGLLLGIIIGQSFIERIAIVPIFMVIGGIVGLFIGGLILLIFFKIFGGSGSYEGTVRILSYSSAVLVCEWILFFTVIPIIAYIQLDIDQGFAWITVIGGIISLYGIWLNIVGGKHVHNLTTVKSAIAVLLPIIIIMVTLLMIPIFCWIFLGSDDSSDQNNIQPYINNSQTEYFNVDGKQVFHRFNSIADGLQMSNPQTYAAQFLDVEYMESTALEPWNEQLPLNLTTVPVRNKDEVDGLYMTSSKQIYFAQDFNNEFLLLSTMTPKIVSFQYIGLPSSDNQYLLLSRLDTTGTNVMGEPTIFTPTRESAEAVISIIESFAVPPTAYDTFSPVLNYSDDYSEFQVVNSLVGFADLYYMGLHRNDDGSFTRTTIYLDASDESAAHINELALSGSERGFSQYDVTTKGDILKVVLAGEFSLVTGEDIQ